MLKFVTKFKCKRFFSTTRKFNPKPLEKNPHKILGVNKRASINEIKKAYIYAAKRYSPDTSMCEEDKYIYTICFGNIKRAYEELSGQPIINADDPNKNSNYTLDCDQDMGKMFFYFLCFNYFLIFLYAATKKDKYIY